MVFRYLLVLLSAGIYMACSLGLEQDKTLFFPYLTEDYNSVYLSGKPQKSGVTPPTTRVDLKAPQPVQEKAPLFTKLPPQQTNITFSNDIKEDIGFNNLVYPLMYNGGGVAIGDINNDGLQDVFLTGNMVSSKLYLNKGNMKFEDITMLAGVTTDRWVTGASMVDINGDGFLDIYLSVAGPEDAPAEEKANLLFINNGATEEDGSIPVFTEKAGDFNVADTSHTTHAVFFDYDRDNFLDLFLLNHSPGSFLKDMADSRHIRAPEQVSTGYDKLYRNNGNGTFTDISKEAGILEVTGYGLGVTVSDINRDGWPDLYVSNDITPNDVLYINNCDGTFTDRAAASLKHTSYAGMGIDIADFNNDGWPDILQVDMMPEDYHEQKKMSYGVDFSNFQAKINQGFYHSYTQNTLQLNNGTDYEGNLTFSEVARMAGVAYTEWSWAALFGDFNNSGYKDILVTNGYPKAVNDFDYLVEIYELGATAGDDENWEQRYQLFQDLDEIKTQNYLFQNEGNIQFKNVSEQWGFTKDSYSYGAAYADLDNNGSLDLVVNNLNAEASVYKNNGSTQQENHYLTIEFEGPIANRGGIGAEVVLTTDGMKQFLYNTPYRGYQSSVDPRLHFGLGEASSVDSLEVFWPDGRYELLTDLRTNQQVTVKHSNSTESYNRKSIDARQKEQRFRDVTEATGLGYNHRQGRYNDFDIQPLLHRQLSAMGPRIATGDVTGNGLDDVYISGSADQAGTLFLQNEEGRFEEFNANQPWLNDRGSEDLGAVFFDANGDEHPDLYVTSGGYMFSPVEDALLDRLYINLGDGRFARDNSALPRMYTSSSVVVPTDFDRDGQVDLFVGGRLIPLKYPASPRSYILKNENGRFRDVTEEVAPALLEPGLITDAIWTDLDQDGWPELVTAGEWLPVQFYKNQNGKLVESTYDMVEKPENGWWYSLQIGDFTNNGYVDIIAGNHGLNDSFTTSGNKRLTAFANDFDNNMTMDIIYSLEEKGVFYPFFGRAKFDRGLPAIRENYPTFSSFSEALTRY